MTIAIIANPLAGRGRGAKTARLTEQILTDKNIDFELIFTKHEGHAIELANQASKNHEIVAALGGDGTIREVLTGIWESEATLGIIPGGTGNDYARGLNIPRQTAPAIEILLQRHAVDFDLGIEDDRIFGVLASVGFPVDVIDYVNLHREGFLKGKLAFLAAVVATVHNLRSFPVQVTIDGQVLEKTVLGLFVMNMPYGGGGMQFTPNAFYGDGLFNVLIIEKVTRTELAITLPKIYSGKHVDHPAVTILTGQEVTVESDPEAIMLDGDIFPARKFHTKILPKATRVLVAKTPV